jgi:cysteine dioxygenase
VRRENAQILEQNEACPKRRTRAQHARQEGLLHEVSFLSFLFVVVLRVAKARFRLPSGVRNVLDELTAVFATPQPDFAVVEQRFFAAVAEVPVAEWSRFAHFDETRYSRNLLAAQENFSLILLCWEPGQTTPVHTHAPLPGSTGPTRCAWSYVLEGDLMLIFYSDTADAAGHRGIEKMELVNKSSPRFTEPTPRGYHALQNLNRTRRAMSLHLYSPAFLDVCWEDSKHEMHSMPVSYTPVCKDAIKPTMRFMGLTQQPFFTSFAALAVILGDELRRGRDIPRMTRILESLRFNPKEFQRYAHFAAGKYTRNLVGYNGAFTLLMLCWDRGQESPIHDHSGSSCFMKILEGELHEVRYDATNPNQLGLRSITQMHEEQVAYIDDTQGVHKMVNPSADRGAISLHVYIPPYVKCSIFNLVDSTCRQVDMAASNAYTDKPFTPLQMNAAGESAPVTVVADLLERLRNIFRPEGPADLALRHEAIRATLDRVHFIASEWRDLVHFSEHNYTRMLLAVNDHFSLVLICWNPRQGCPLHAHNHAPENHMFVKVVVGGLQLTRFSDASGKQMLSDAVYEPESPCLTMSNKDLGFHTTRNASSELCTLSLHLYTPPMLECVHSEGVAPVVYSKSSAEAAPSPQASLAMTAVPVPEAAGLLPGEQPLLAAASGLFSPERAKLRLAGVNGCASLFSNFQTLMETLWNMFDHLGERPVDSLTDRVMSVLQKFEFNPKEIEQYKTLSGAGAVRRRVALHSKFEIYVVCWQGSFCIGVFFFFFF